MSTISDEGVKDLEKGVETCTETSGEESDGEGIQLLEDRSAGKLVYFFSPYFFKRTWILDIFLSFAGTCYAFFAQSMYIIVYEFYHPQFEAELSDIFSPLWLSWLIINYLLLFTIFFTSYIHDRKNVNIETKALQKLLEEVAEIDLMGDPEAWRRIASRVNQCFMKKRYNNSIFYGGEQCRRFFLREIVKPIESGSYDIDCCRDEKRCRDYFQNPSNKKLAERAVSNYNKSIETFDQFSDTDEKNDWGDRLFEKIRNIMWTIFVYFWATEFTVFFFVMLVVLVLGICHVIFSLISYVYSGNFLIG